MCECVRACVSMFVACADVRTCVLLFEVVYSSNSFLLNMTLYYIFSFLPVVLFGVCLLQGKHESPECCYTKREHIIGVRQN